MNDSTSTTIVVVIVLALFIGIFAIFASAADECKSKHCDHGEPLFVARDGICICVEVPK